MTTQPDRQVQQGLPFEEQASSVLQHLRGTFSALIQALPDSGSIRNAADLQRVLGVAGTPAWQVFKVANAIEPLAAGPQVPGRHAMGRVFEAAADRGIGQRELESARQAFAAFEQLVRNHAGGRRRDFNSMISGLSNGRPESIDLSQRRAAFRANSHLWGVQSKTSLICGLYHPGAVPNTCDSAAIRGYVDLCRLRSDVRFIMHKCRHRGEEKTRIDSEAIDASEHERRTGLLRNFCSKPLPDFRMVVEEDGGLATELQAGPIGTTAAVTYFLADSTHGLVVRQADEETPTISMGMTIKTPVEMVVFDMLVYDGMFGEVDPKATVYGRVVNEGTNFKKWSDSDQLPLRPQVIWAGRGPSAVQLAAVPRYPEMLEYVCRKLGWDAQKFDVYRCKVEYPVLHSTQVIRFDVADDSP